MFYPSGSATPVDDCYKTLPIHPFGGGAGANLIFI
jgi:hypothetical protein